MERENPTQDDLFMTMVYLVAAKSKDAKTHMGAVIVGPDNEVRTVGYNGFPRGINDYVPGRQERPEKYFWVEHAERNAIYNATLMGVSLKNCRLYINGIPCAACARAIIQAGIKEVILDPKWEKIQGKKWEEHAKRTFQMFFEAGINVRQFRGKFIKIYRFKDGKKRRLE